MERKPAIDIMKGIAIILVIIGHLQIPVFFSSCHIFFPHAFICNSKWISVP